MPGETAGAGPGPSRAALRFGLGVGSIFALGQLFAWPMAFLAAVFAAMLLQAPRPAAMRIALALVLGAAALLLAASFWATGLMRFPAPFYGSLALFLYLVFLRSARGGGAVVTLFALLGLLLIPALVRTSPDLAVLAAKAIPTNLALAFLAAWIWFAIIPPDAHAKPAPRPEPPDPADAPARALKMLAVVAPLAIFLLAIESSYILTLIFVAILAQQLSATATAAAGKAMLVSNALGGVAAAFSYEILVIAPREALLVALSFAGLLAGAALIWSGKPWAKLAASGVTAWIVLLGGSLTPLSGDVDAKLAERLWQIGLAVGYVYVAVSLPEWLRRPEKADQTGRQAGPMGSNVL